MWSCPPQLFLSFLRISLRSFRARFCHFVLCRLCIFGFTGDNCRLWYRLPRRLIHIISQRESGKEIAGEISTSVPYCRRKAFHDAVVQAQDIDRISGCSDRQIRLPQGFLLLQDIFCPLLCGNGRQKPRPNNGVIS